MLTRNKVVRLTTKKSKKPATQQINEMLDLWKAKFINDYKQAQHKAICFEKEYSFFHTVVMKGVFTQINSLSYVQHVVKAKFEFLNMLKLLGRGQRVDSFLKQLDESPKLSEERFLGVVYAITSWEYYLWLKEQTAMKKGRKISSVKKPANDVSYKAIAIACHFMDIRFSKETALDYLKKYSRYKSVNTLLKYKITGNVRKLSELNKSNRTADTKHLNALKAAERLVKGEKYYAKQDEHLSNITRVITEFQTLYDKQYLD